MLIIKIADRASNLWSNCSLFQHIIGVGSVSCDGGCKVIGLVYHDVFIRHSLFFGDLNAYTDLGTFRSQKFGIFLLIFFQISYHVNYTIKSFQ